MAPPQSSQPLTTFRKWLDRAILCCLPALALNVFLAVGSVLVGFASPFARFFFILFTLILVGIGVVLLIHFTDVVLVLTGKALSEKRFQIARWFGSVSSGLLCILLAWLMITNLAHFGDLVGGDAVLMQAEIFTVGPLIWWRIRQRRLAELPSK